MSLAWISLVDFRSYRDLDWHPDPEVNLLVGENGTGKTNLLEGIAFLATLRSLRAAPDEALVAEGAERAVLRGAVTRGGAESIVEVELPGRGSRRVRVNGSRLQRSSGLGEILRVVTFLPEDLGLVKGGPSARRDFLDGAASTLWPGAALDQAEFERVLRQRNALLRSGDRDADSLGVWDARLSQAGGRVMGRRARAVVALAERLRERYRAVAGEASIPSWAYGSAWGGSLDPAVTTGEWAEALARALAAARSSDWERRVTGVGPHRDDPVILLDGRDSRFHASQGEQRTIALALRLALHGATLEMAGMPPLLLLDDVFSELDPVRSQALADHLPAGQTIISTARADDVPVSGKLWRVERGMVT